MYVESGLFWAFVVVVVITVSIMYTTLNNKLLQQRIKNEELLKKIAKAKYATENSTQEDVEVIKEQVASILDDLSFVYLVLSTIVDNSNNTTKNKIETLIRRRNKKKKGENE